jgi:hypothetical protein
MVKKLKVGWAKSQVSIIDEDLGVSGKVFVKRSGFDHLNAEVALGRVGILLGLGVSRLARSIPGSGIGYARATLYKATSFAQARSASALL